MKFFDPEGTEYGIPTYPRRLAPEGLATRRQLRARGLRPAGQPVVAQILWFGRRPLGSRERLVRVAYLYRLDLARPVRPMTPGLWRAHHAMMRARRTCPVCTIHYPYVMPTSLGCCPACADAPALAA
ncbi:RRQRL motif-containing zinc-binding protein [Streptomyces chryseus]|uniref:RRQRL motif-containing zinc-binding protein n=1 Tax=Streptomyces chryseus TaxID=68186 RepID=UPI00110FC428|nr:RRQRL motif-containing zinc-binding protein [Streptomyces chryseus]